MSGRWFARAEGVLLASLDDRWAAHSSLAGGSHLLNDESAAILLALSPDVPVAEATVYQALAADSGEAPESIEALVSPVWDHLLSAGLVTEREPANGS